MNRIEDIYEFIKVMDRGWRLELGTGEGDFTELLTTDMLSHEMTEKDGAIIQTWHGHKEYGADFTIITNWKTTEDGRYEGTISYSNYEGSLYIEQIHFPFLKAYFDEESKYTLTGRNYNIKIFPAGVVRDFPVRSIQFCAILNKNAQSVYADWRDKDWNTKDCLVIKDADSDTVTFAGLYYAPMYDKPKTASGIPYPSSIKLYDGSWFEASQFYKPWALQQEWWLKCREDNPLKDIDLWVWNRGLVKDVIPPIEQLNKDLGGCKVALDWYWWHHNPYDTDYPNFWPPREGEEAFKAAIKRLNEQNISSQVYVNGVCWDHDTYDWEEGGSEGVRVQRDGNLKETAFNQYNNHRLAWQCGTATKFQQRIYDLVDKLHASGLTSQYLDQIGCSTFWCCHHKGHNHPMGGGHYHVEGVRKMLMHIREAHPNYPLTSETGSEPYMDLLDGGIICGTTSQERMGGGDDTELVPTFEAVYHGKFALFGNYALPDGIPPWDPLWPDEDRWQGEEPWHKIFPEQFYVEMARTILFGAQPMVCNIHSNICTDPEYAAEYKFILDTVKFYAANKDYLFSGEMLSPNGFECPQKEIAFHCRMIFTKKKDATITRKIMPTILHGYWKNPEGVSALLMANVTQEPQTWSFKGQSGTIPPRSYLKVII